MFSNIIYSVQKQDTHLKGKSDNTDLCRNETDKILNEPDPSVFDIEFFLLFYLFPLSQMNTINY